jgi:hypothetical protein
MLPIDPASEHAPVRSENEPRLATDMDDRTRSDSAHGRKLLAQLQIIGAVALVGLHLIPQMLRLR